MLINQAKNRGVVWVDLTDVQLVAFNCVKTPTVEIYVNIKFKNKEESYTLVVDANEYKRIKEVLVHKDVTKNAYIEGQQEAMRKILGSLEEHLGPVKSPCGEQVQAGHQPEQSAKPTHPPKKR